MHSGIDNDRIIQKFIAECKERIAVDIEHSQTFVKVAIIKKKHYFGVTTNGQIKVGMEGKKNDNLYGSTKYLIISLKTLK